MKYQRLPYCQRCGKWPYRTRKAARHAAGTLHPNDSGLHAYRCPHNTDVWHYGHRPQRVTG